MTEENLKNEKAVISKTSEGVAVTPIKCWVDDKNKIQVAVDPFNGCDCALEKVTGTKDFDLAANIAKAATLATLPAEASQMQISDAFNVYVQGMNDYQPTSALEARLVAQSGTLYHHGMDRLGRAARSDHIDHSQVQVNMAVKLLRLHNETIEALSRYRRGGSQNINVTHAVVANQAIINQFSPESISKGSHLKNKESTPCSLKNAEPKLEQLEISHADSPLCQMVDADCMEVKAQVPKRSKEKRTHA